MSRRGGPPVLNPRQQKFVDIYLQTSNATHAAREAGYSCPARVGQYLVSQSVTVKNYLESIRKEVAKKTVYNAQVAMEEALDAIKFAKKTKNANALVKAIELRTKLNGLLVEKHDIRSQAFSINISGIDGPSAPAPTKEEMDALGLGPAINVIGKKVEDEDDHE